MLLIYSLLVLLLCCFSYQVDWLVQDYRLHRHRTTQSRRHT